MQRHKRADERFLETFENSQNLFWSEDESEWEQQYWQILAP